MPLPVDAGLFSAALVGYRQKLQEIDAHMTNLRLRWPWESVIARLSLGLVMK
jgi:hypothetical protein